MEKINVKITGVAPLMQHRYIFKDELANKNTEENRGKRLQRRMEKRSILG